MLEPVADSYRPTVAVRPARRRVTKPSFRNGSPCVRCFVFDEVDRAGPEVADGRRQARVVGQVPEPGVLRDERQLGVRQRDRQAGTELARDEAVTIRARIGGARSRTEPLDELAAQALAGDERDTVAPVAALVAAADRDEEETQHHHRPTHHSRP